MTGTNILILACSPRRGGNSDFMAKSFAEGVESAGGKAEVVYLRDLVIKACLACQLCAQRPDHSCPLSRDENDAAEALFKKIKDTPHLFIAAPIFFYALPAHFKGFIDRGQRLWAEKAARQAGLTPNQGDVAAPDGQFGDSSEQPNATPPGTAQNKPATIGLVAGNKKGQKLFEGSLLTLRYFLDVFDAEIINTCLMRGHDAPRDLANDRESVKTIVEAGAAALTTRA